jgi:hypothetical protein
VNYFILAEIILAIFIIIAPISMLAVIIVNGILEWLDGRDKEDN